MCINKVYFFATVWNVAKKICSLVASNEVLMASLQFSVALLAVQDWAISGLFVFFELVLGRSQSAFSLKMSKAFNSFSFEGNTG